MLWSTYLTTGKFLCPRLRKIRYGKPAGALWLFSRTLRNRTRVTASLVGLVQLPLLIFKPTHYLLAQTRILKCLEQSWTCRYKRGWFSERINSVIVFIFFQSGLGQFKTECELQKKLRLCSSASCINGITYGLFVPKAKLSSRFISLVQRGKIDVGGCDESNARAGWFLWKGGPLLNRHGKLCLLFFRGDLTAVHLTNSYRFKGRCNLDSHK